MLLIKLISFCAALSLVLASLLILLANLAYRVAKWMFCIEFKDTKVFIVERIEK